MEKTDNRGVSNVVGIMMMLLLVVLLVGVGSAGVLGSASELWQGSPLVDFRYDVTNETVNITHSGGDSIDTATVTVIFEGTDGNETRFGLENSTVVDADGDGRFEVGEERSHSHSIQSSAWIEITIIHKPTNSIISDAPNAFRVPG